GAERGLEPAAGQASDRMDRSQRLRSVEGLRRSGAEVRHGCARPAGVRQVAPGAWASVARLQGAEPARAEDAPSRRRPGDLLLLLPRVRSGLSGGATRGRGRRPALPADPGATPPGAGPPQAAGRARDYLP